MVTTDWEVLEKRVSCRSYREKKMIEEEKLEKLSDFIEEMNQESGLHFQLQASKKVGVPAIKLPSSMFSGIVYAFVALVGGEDPVSAEKIGYYGEKLILYAEKLGLGTCWVAGTYDKKSFWVEVPPEEKLWGVITLGYAADNTPAKQKMIRATVRRKDRRIEEFLEARQEFDRQPRWLQKGVEAVKLGPSAANQQPVNIVFQEGKVFARIWKKGNGLESVDLGIAKQQFEVGAASCGVHGTWEFGEMGGFRIK